MPQPMGLGTKSGTMRDIAKVDSYSPLRDSRPWWPVET